MMIAFREFLNHQTKLPFDCLEIISEYIPSRIHERCIICGDAVILVDKKGRLFFKESLVCSECIILCADCFECKYD